MSSTRPVLPCALVPAASGRDAGRRTIYGLNAPRGSQVAGLFEPYILSALYAARFEWDKRLGQSLGEPGWRRVGDLSFCRHLLWPQSRQFAGLYCGLRIADCGLRIVWASIFREMNPQSAIRNGDRDLTPRHRYPDNVSPLPESQVAAAALERLTFPAGTTRLR